MLRGIAARLSANVAAADARCDASRSMRAQCNRSSSSFETRVRSFEFAEALELRAPQDEDEQRGRTVFTFQTAVLVAAARFLRPGFALPLHAPPEGVGGAPRVVRVLARHPWGLHVTRQARRLARRLASHTGDARLPALHRGGFGLRSRASLTGIASGSVTASSSRPGRSARRAGSRTSRGQRLRAAAAGRHALLRIQDRLENTPLNEHGCDRNSRTAHSSQYIFSFVVITTKNA